MLCSMRLNTVSVRDLIMNVETTPFKSSNIYSMNAKLYVKSAAISLSLLLGACAATGDQVEEMPTAAQAKVEKVEQEADKTPSPSAAELMKTLKAPLVEPPSAEVTVAQAKPKPAPAPVQKVAKKDVAQKVEVQTNKQVEAIKTVQPIVVEKTQVATEPKKIAPVVKPAEREKPLGIDAAPFNVSASKLPFSYDIWTIREGDTPLTEGLVIVTPTWEMGKEGYTSQIWFTMMEDEIHVNSSSDIETASKGLGIRIDGGELIPFTSIAEKNIGVISGKWLNSLAAANKIDVYLGFFPGKKPTSETFVSDLSLKNLARMVATYRTLTK